MDTRQQTRRGNYSMLMGFTIVGILGFGAIGVDISYLAMASTQAQAVSDAAAQAAILTYRASDAATHADRVTEARQAAQWVVDSNRVGVDGPGTMENFEFGTYDHVAGTFNGGGGMPNAVNVGVGRTDNPLQTFLAGVIGVDEMTVSRDAVAAFQPRHVMLVLDHSCSMWLGRGVPESNGLSGDAWEEIGGVHYSTAHHGVRDAITAFAGYSIDRAVVGDAMGASVFAGFSTLWQPLEELDGFSGDMYTAFADWGPPNAIQGGRSFSGDIRRVIHVAGPPGGYYWAYDTNGNRQRSLTGNSGNPRPNGRDDCADNMDRYFRWEGWNQHPLRTNVCDIGTCTNPEPAIDDAIGELVASSDLAFKAIIVISDGEPTCGGEDSGFLAATQRADDEGIHVWTVAYDGSDGIDAGLMQSAAKGMGSYYETPSADELDDILIEIARSFPVAVVQ